jgi:hypothetical protein
MTPSDQRSCAEVALPPSMASGLGERRGPGVVGRDERVELEVRAALFAGVHVAEEQLQAVLEQHVGGLEVAVHELVAAELVEAQQQLDGQLPDAALVHARAGLPVPRDERFEAALLGQLEHQAG